MLSPYLLQENDDFSFEFKTDQGIKYKVYFLDYSYMFSDYPKITCPVFTLNIEAIEGYPDISSGDDRVGQTISVIINRFFINIKNVAVYVCDSLDERQLSRKRKFDSWFIFYNDGSLIKEDGIAFVDGMKIYNAMILHKKNDQLKEIILAFNELNERADDK